MKISDILQMNEKNTLLEAMNKLKGMRGKEELENLWFTYVSFEDTFSFLLITWNRIQNDVRMIEDGVSIEANYAPHWHEDADPGEPTEDEKRQIAEGRKHKDIVHLDMENWFIHAHILMDKFAKLAYGIFVSICTEEKKQEATHISFKSFHKFKNYFEKKGKSFDSEFPSIMNQYTQWFEPELKDIRDDLIQHESSFKMWGSSFRGTQTDISFSFSKFKPYHVPEKFHTLIERNLTRFPQINQCYSILAVLKIFDEHWNELDQVDRCLVVSIKQSYGGDFPDIIKLFSKMSVFFTQVNDYFVRKIEEKIIP